MNLFTISQKKMWKRQELAIINYEFQLRLFENKH